MTSIFVCRISVVLTILAFSLAVFAAEAIPQSQDEVVSPTDAQALPELFTVAVAAQDQDWRTVELETNEVTAADVAISPDGKHLIFTLLGQLFLLPVEGGVAEQLTFGPSQNSDPMFSPRGTRVAFASNRDGSDGNIFVLDLASRTVSQITHERWAGRPAWSFDGSEIAYLSFLTRGHHCPAGQAIVRRTSLNEHRSETVDDTRDNIRSVFYLPEGNIGWSAHQRGTADNHSDDKTHIRTLRAPSSVETLATFDVVADRVFAHPGGQGFFLRARHAALEPEFILHMAGQDLSEKQITSLSPQFCFYGSGGFAFAPAEEAIYVGDIGRLWRISLKEMTREPIRFSARVVLQIRSPTPAPKVRFNTPGNIRPPRSIQSPRLSPDGQSLVYGAAGHLWRQALEGGPARRLMNGQNFERDPVFSPDGNQLLFIWSNGWKQELRVLDLESNEVRALATGSSYWHPAWSQDAKQVVFVEQKSASAPHISVLDVANGNLSQITVAGLDAWLTSPQFGPDGRSLIYAASQTGMSAIYRVTLDGEPEPRSVTLLDRHVHAPLLSPDGTWLAFRHNSEIWLAPLQGDHILEADAKRVSEEGGEGFAFTPDGTALVYASGNRVWQQLIHNGERTELPVTFRLNYAMPRPLLVSNVRLLDFAAGQFGPETSLLIEEGRIRWVGNAQDRELPQDIDTLDGGGRFVIPGLFDMHAHIQRDFQPTWLAYGVTSIRDLGGQISWVAALADRSAASAVPIPRIFFSGDILHGASTTRDPIMISSASEARAYARRWSVYGVHNLKTHPGLTWSAQRALVDEAHRLGVPVTEHGYPLDYLFRSVTVGGAFLEHHYPGLRYFDDVFQLLANSGTRWTPTLVAGYSPAVFSREVPEHWVDEKLRSFTRQEVINQMLGYGMLDDALQLSGYWRQHRAEIRDAWKRGVKLQIGTDYPYAMPPVPGASLHQEMAAFVDAGIPALEVIRMATQQAARALGAEEDVGSLEAGKLADMILLDGNPVDDIYNAQKVWRVVKGGWVFDPEELRPDLTGAEN